MTFARRLSLSCTRPKLELCDRYSAYADFLRTLNSSRGGYTATLADLNDAAKARYAPATPLAP